MQFFMLFNLCCQYQRHSLKGKAIISYYKFLTGLSRLIKNSLFILTTVRLQQFVILHPFSIQFDSPSFFNKRQSRLRITPRNNSQFDSVSLFIVQNIKFSYLLSIDFLTVFTRLEIKTISLKLVFLTYATRTGLLHSKKGTPLLFGF